MLTHVLALCTVVGDLGLAAETKEPLKLDSAQAVAIARKYCRDPPQGQTEIFDLTCQPAFRDEGALER